MGLFSKRIKQNKTSGTKSFSFNLSAEHSTLLNQNLPRVCDNSVVVSAVKWASRAYMEAPLIVQKFNKSTNRYETVPNHPATALLKNPNPYMSGTALFNGVLTSLMLDGNAYILKVRNQSTGRVVELWYVSHSAIEPFFDKAKPDEWIAGYKYRVNDRDFLLPIDDVIHIRDGVDPDNQRKGFSGLKSVTREILTDQECSVYTHSILKNLGVIGYTVTAKDEHGLDIDNAEYIKKQLMEQYTGERRGEPLVFTQPLDIQTQGYSPEQMALDKMRSVPEQRITAVLGIPSQVLGLASGNDSKTYANQKEARESVYESWIIPTYRNVSETLNLNYLSEFGDPRTEQIIYDISEVRILQEDANAKSDRILRQWQSGAITRGEARQQLGYQSTAEDNIYFFDASLGSITASTAKSFVMQDIAQRIHLQRTLFEQKEIAQSDASPN